MTDENEKKDDSALFELLDEAEQDFKKRVEEDEAKKKSKATTTTTTTNTDDEVDAMMEGYDRKAAQKAANEFNTMLEHLRKGQEERGNVPEEDEDDDAKLLRQLFETMGKLGVGDVGGASTSTAGPGPSSSRGGENEDFGSESGMLATIMQALASKEVMYEPLREIRDAYPKYFESNSETLDAETLERYRKQFDVIVRICAEYEHQPDNDDDEEGGDGNRAEIDDKLDPAAEEAAFDRIGQMLVELQSYGQPPTELTGPLPAGWSLNTLTGLPNIDDATKAAEGCAIM